LDEVADVQAKLLPANARGQPSSRDLRELASQIYESRCEQHRLLSGKNYGEPAWDMMIALYCFPRKGIFLGVTSLAHVANISEAAGSRWQRVLLEEGLIERGPCVDDARRQLVRLTDNGRRLIESYLIRLFYRDPDVSESDGFEN
jgi:DNA-binding MarR family transcriptional regulator